MPKPNGQGWIYICSDHLGAAEHDLAHISLGRRRATTHEKQVEQTGKARKPRQNS